VETPAAAADADADVLASVAADCILRFLDACKHYK